MSYETCRHCGAHLDYGEKCDCRSEKAQQLQLTQWEKWSDAIGRCLLQLRPPGGDAPRISDYCQYESARDVPDTERDALLEKFEKEVAARKWLGDAYFAVRSLAGKTALYQKALELLPAIAKKAGTRPGDNPMFVDFRALHNQALAAAAKKIAQEAAEAKETAKRPRFKKPTLEEVAAFCKEAGLLMDPEAYYDHFESNGWKVGGKAPMRDWQAACRQWARRAPSMAGMRPRNPNARIPSSREAMAAGQPADDILAAAPYKPLARDSNRKTG